MRDYRKIEAWRMADDLTVAVYEGSRSFPREEIYGLTSQLRRAAYSVPANIAEGAARESKREYLHSLYISRGSLAEAQYFVHLARRLDFLPDGDADRLLEQAGKTFACLQGLIMAVEKEVGMLTRLVAFTSSLLALELARIAASRGSAGLWS